jgi:hypothetical protein
LVLPEFAEGFAGGFERRMEHGGRLPGPMFPRLMK